MKEMKGCFNLCMKAGIMPIMEVRIIYLKNSKDSSVFSLMNSDKYGLEATRWSLAVGTVDINKDGFTDLYIANDFGRDELLSECGR